MYWLGKYAVFASRAAAEVFCREQRRHGNHKAYVSTLNSHVMTSDSSPIVVNAKAEKMQNM